MKIEVRGGFYELRDTIHLTPQDSGTPASPTVIEAYKRERPIFSGGFVLKCRNESGRWIASEPFRIEQLYVDGERKQRPRWPKDGYAIVDKTVASTADVGAKGFNRFEFAPGDVKPEWAETGESEVLAFHLWTMDRMPLQAVDPGSNVATIGGFCLPAGYSSLNKGTRYIIENIPEVGPDEWYQDYRTGEIQYLPTLPWQEHVIVAPQLETLLRVEGNSETPVHDVTLKGLGFDYSAYHLPPTGHAFPQADIDVSAAIELSDARDITLDNFSIEHTGGWAVAFHAGCESDLLENARLQDLGAGGVKIGETAMPPDPKDLVQRITLRNCLIAHGGRIHPAATGVWIGESADDHILGNTIDDFYYTGVSVGWVWGYGPSMTQNVEVKDNRITNIGQEVLSDMGGIYTLGNEHGTVLDHNRIDHVDGFYYGGWGIYFDEGTTDIEAKNNLVTNCKTGCFHQHYGKNNHVHNNIFDGSKEVGLIIRTRAEDHLSFHFDHNILVNDGPLLASNWSGRGYEMDHNDYWNPHPGSGDFPGKTWAQWQADGNDVGSVFADPSFVGSSYRLAAGSPALRQGFVPFSLSGFGSSLSGEGQTKAAFPVFRRKEYPENIQ